MTGHLTKDAAAAAIARSMGAYVAEHEPEIRRSLAREWATNSPRTDRWQIVDGVRLNQASARSRGRDSSSGGS